MGKIEINGRTVPALKPGLDQDRLKLTREEKQVLALVDGRADIDGIARSGGLTFDRAREAIVALLGRGALVLAPAAPAPLVAVVEDVPVNPVDISRIRSILHRPLPTGDNLLPVVEEVFINLEYLSYYDLLGLPRQTEPTAVKKAYILRTKVFHPDRFYRRVDNDFKIKLQEIFKQVHKGYRVLTDAEQKCIYDESLGQEEIIADEGPAVTFSPVGRERAVKGAPLPREATATKRVERTGAKPPAPAKTAVAEDRSEPIPVKPATPKLKLGLRPGTNPMMEKVAQMKSKEKSVAVSQAERFFQGAMTEKERGNLNSARINLQLAIQYDPWNQKYKKAIEGLQSDADSRKAERAFKAGLNAHQDGDLKKASGHYQEALQLGYENAKLYHKFAELVVELEANYEKARALCLKAIELQAGVAEFHLTLARAYKGLNQKAAAIMQLEKVISLDPKNKLAAKELKTLKRS